MKRIGEKEEKEEEELKNIKREYKSKEVYKRKYIEESGRGNKIDKKKWRKHFMDLLDGLEVVIERKRWRGRGIGG